MKISTKFFIITIAVNVMLSFISAWSSMKEMRLVDIVTFYATAFGAGASFAGAIISLRRKKIEQEKNKKNFTE